MVASAHQAEFQLFFENADFCDYYLGTTHRSGMLGQVGKYSQTFLLTSLKIFELCLNISWLRGNLYGCAEIYMAARKFI